jgi:DNA-binding HxlR family transcriptional regulator
MRFTRLGEFIGGVSQKMLTKTLRQMEADGLVSRTVFPGRSLLRCLDLGRAAP